MNLIKMLGRLVSIYQEIIKDLDISLSVIASLTEDEDIISTITSVRDTNIKRLQDAQILIDILIDQYQFKLFEDSDDKTKH